MKKKKKICFSIDEVDPFIAKHMCVFSVSQEKTAKHAMPAQKWPM